MSEIPLVRLEYWGVTNHPQYPRTEPCLRGRAYGHPRFAEGEVIITEPVTELRAGHVLTRSGTLYELGKLDLDALSDAFAINREFAYLVLLLCLISPAAPETPPIAFPNSSEPASVISIVARAALSRSGGGSTVQ